VPTLRVDDRDVRLTNLDKILYPTTGTTKADVIHYYVGVAEYLIRYAHDRPATRKRWPDGVQSESFFEKNLREHAPIWIARASLQHSDRVASYPLINDTSTLLALAQSAALELHVPQWQFDSAGTPQAPDRLVIDLDPGDPAGLDECCEVALAARDWLGADGLASYPVTSGSKGMQLYANVVDHDARTDTTAYAKHMAAELTLALPDLVLGHMTRADREGKVFVDWSQNNPAKTTIAPYSLRGRAQPNAAAPRTWEEVEAGGLSQLRFDEVLGRIDQLGDPLSGLLD